MPARGPADTGWAVPGDVGLAAAGGRRGGPRGAGACVVVRGLQWLCRRSRDLVPVVLRALAEGLRPRAAR